MRTILSGLMAAAVATAAMVALPAPASAEPAVYYGDSPRIYRVESDRSWRNSRTTRHHRPYLRLRRGDDPYFYRSYRAFGPRYDRPYYERRYHQHRGWGRHYHRHHRPGFSIEFGF